ncbi:ATP-binding protein [Streptomyces chartreusis]|jgi:anti-sigma regulatory factor (Ser/Thr protein kinase)|uniref:ATP-binding protein n=1 Tax=Streptomyces chartreusis TaxID=1969 RepID=UPI0038654BEA|nr:ATP-binding protein [Streptomyces chartreusis]
MVTPLDNRSSDERDSAPLRHSTAWHSDTSLAEARAAVRALLVRAGYDPDHRPGQDAPLIVSELVSNALRHAPGSGRLVLEVTPDDGLLRITVSDTSPRPPELRTHDARRVGGHGLRLVNRLCDRLHTVTPATGKQVAAHLHLHKPAD